MLILKFQQLLTIFKVQWNSMHQTLMQENSYLKLPHISNQLWCLKNEQHLNIDQNFDHQMSLSKSKCLYSNNCLCFLKRSVPLKSEQSFRQRFHLREQVQRGVAQLHLRLKRRAVRIFGNLGGSQSGKLYQPDSEGNSRKNLQSRYHIQDTSLVQSGFN